jgi:L-amino acid N-acyltransferase YncA
MNIDFRPTQETDLAALGEILNYYIENTNVNFHIKALGLSELQESLLAEDQRFKTFTIFLDKKIIGFVQITPHKKRAAYNCTGEISVYLVDIFCGKGTGKKAVSFIENFARENKFHSLIATICGENIPSINLFQNCGYVKCSHYKEVGRKFDQYLDVVAYQKII